MARGVGGQDHGDVVATAEHAVGTEVGDGHLDTGKPGFARALGAVAIDVEPHRVTNRAGDLAEVVAQGILARAERDGDELISEASEAAAANADGVDAIGIGARLRLGHGVRAGEQVGEGVGAVGVRGNGEVDGHTVEIRAGQGDVDTTDARVGTGLGAVVVDVVEHDTRDGTQLDQTGIDRGVVDAGHGDDRHDQPVGVVRRGRTAGVCDGGEVAGRWGELHHIVGRGQIGEEIGATRAGDDRGDGVPIDVSGDRSGAVGGVKGHGGTADPDLT